MGFQSAQEPIPYADPLTPVLALNFARELEASAELQPDPEPPAGPPDPIRPSPGPSNTWDRLIGGAPLRTADPFDDEATITPQKGGELRSTDGRLKVQFPPQAVNETVKLRYKLAGFAPHPLPDGKDTYLAFGLEAYTLSGSPVTRPAEQDP